MKIKGLTVKGEVLTTTTPQKAGLYWAKYGGDEGDEMQLVEVIMHAQKSVYVAWMNNTWYDLDCFTHWTPVMVGLS